MRSSLRNQLLLALILVAGGPNGSGRAGASDSESVRQAPVELSDEARRAGWGVALSIVGRLEDLDATAFPGTAAFVGDLQQVASRVRVQAPPAMWPEIDTAALISRNPNFWTAHSEVAPGDPVFLLVHAGVLLGAGEADRAADVLLLTRQAPDVPAEIRQRVDALYEFTRGGRAERNSRPAAMTGAHTEPLAIAWNQLRHADHGQLTAGALRRLSELCQAAGRDELALLSLQIAVGRGGSGPSDRAFAEVSLRRLVRPPDVQFVLDQLDRHPRRIAVLTRRSPPRPPWTGQAALVGLAAVMFVWAVRNGRAGRWRPPQPAGDSRAAGTSRFADRLLPAVLLTAVATSAVPLVGTPEHLGFGDWDYHLHEYEVVRQSILDWQQFPWWNPYRRGGFPLAAEPQCGVISLATALGLGCGTAVGLRLAAVAYILLAIEGARRLARLWFGESWAAAVAGLIYGINGAVTVYASAGLYVPMSYFCLPWLLYFAFRLEQATACGLWLGAWSATLVLSGWQYPSAYSVLLAATVGAVRLPVLTPELRSAFLRNAAIAAGVCLAAAGWRLGTTGLVLRDYPRVLTSPVDRPLAAVASALWTRPGAERLLDASAEPLWETACYVGPLVVLLAIGSLRHGWRWWHALAFMCLWLSWGSAHWYQPSFWLAAWPGFSTMHVVSRWRIVALLGLAMAAASVIADWRRRPARGWRMAAVVLVVAVATDLLVYAHQILPIARSLPATPDRFPGPQTHEITTLERWESAGGGQASPQFLSFPSLLRGYAIVRAPEPLLGYDLSGPTKRMWLGHPRYVGEFWSGEQPVTPASWSPNRITFQLAPHQTIEVNQNPGSWWLVNGRRAFEAMRCAEWNQRFTAEADGQGRLELRTRPKGLLLAAALTWFGLTLLWAAIRSPPSQRVTCSTEPAQTDHASSLP